MLHNLAHVELNAIDLAWWVGGWVGGWVAGCHLSCPHAERLVPGPPVAFAAATACTDDRHAPPRMCVCRDTLLRFSAFGLPETFYADFAR